MFIEGFFVQASKHCCGAPLCKSLNLVLGKACEEPGFARDRQLDSCHPPQYPRSLGGGRDRRRRVRPEMLALPPIARDCSTAVFLALVSVVVSTLMSFLSGPCPKTWHENARRLAIKIMRLALLPPPLLHIALPGSKHF